MENYWASRVRGVKVASHERMIADIRFACTACGQYMRADATAAGLAADCPHCGRPVVVPAGDGAHGGETPGSHQTDSRTDLERLEQQLAVSMSECERLTAAVTHAQAEIKSFQSDRRAMKSELAQTRQRLGVAETHISEQQHALAAAQQSAAEWATQCESLQNDLGIAQARANALAAQLAARDGQVAALQQQLAERDAAHSAAQAEISALQEEHAILRGDLDAAAASGPEREALANRLAETEAEWSKTMAQVEASEAARAALEQRWDALTKEAATLRADLNETASGREFVRLREQVAMLEDERHRLRLANAELTEDGVRINAEATAAAELVQTLRQRLGDAEKRADAVSDERLRQDNLALRGIITRQNGELERRHVELHRLKRARLILRILYALIVLGIVALGYAAIQIIPSLDW
jgi:chromosome segregation ATPase